jgi:uncharacterized membrane-anchored protein
MPNRMSNILKVGVMAGNLYPDPDMYWKGIADCVCYPTIIFCLPENSGTAIQYSLMNGQSFSFSVRLPEERYRLHAVFIRTFRMKTRMEGKERVCMSDYYCLPFSSHPLREQLYDELHARPFYPVATPRQITHLAFKSTPAELDEAFALFGGLCRRYGLAPPDDAGVSFDGDFGDLVVRWERHMEFYTLTCLKNEASAGQAFARPALDLLPEEWLAALPGQAVTALHLEVVGPEADVGAGVLERVFEGERLMVSRPKDGKALLCTAVKLHGDGFGRILIQNRGISDYQMGRLVQRLYELETYRLLALLALPIAKRLAPGLHEMDRELVEMLARLPSAENSAGERFLLARLSELSTRLETWRAETNYRFSATWAYRELVMSRLQNIREVEVEGHMTLAEFITRRLNPGLRTCESVQAWLEDLSRRIERAGDMMRTRVNLTLQEQNKELLAAMNRRSFLQFRLQETVEGLSVAAISYYLVGLVGYLLGGLPLEALHIEKKVLMAGVVPLVLIGVWWLVRRIKHRLIKQPAAEECPALNTPGTD